MKAAKYGVALSIVSSVSLLGFVAQCHAATKAAATCSYTDVNQAVTSASVGDTVTVPAGSCTWSSTLVLSKGISLIGAGKTATIINNQKGTLIDIRNANDNLVRVSGMRFNNSDNQSPIIHILGPAYKVRIDHVYMNKGDAAIASNFFSKGGGPVYGVVDNSDFYNTKRTYFSTDLRTGDRLFGVGAWAEFLGSEATFPGTNKMMYFEDNQFVWNSSLTDPNAQGALYGQYGGKAAFRHNTFSGFCTYIDAHGDGPDYGTIYYEVYNNTFNWSGSLCGQDSIVWMRGGQLIAHHNTFNGSTKPFRMSVYSTNDLDPHRVKNTYYWANSWNGNTDQSSMVMVTDSGQTPAGYSATNIKVNEQYFLQAPQPGQVFYPYTPYTYPHPLRSEAAPSLQAPTNLRLVPHPS